MHSSLLHLSWSCQILKCINIIGFGKKPDAQIFLINVISQENAQKTFAFLERKRVRIPPKGNMKYNPQMTEGKPYKSKGLGNRGASSVVRCNLKQKEIDNKGERLPINVLEFKHDKEHFHPTQKPVDLLRYLIRTYTDEGDTVLDPTFGSGSAGVAAALENRNFIGIEKDENYFNIGKERIEKSLQKNE